MPASSIFFAGGWAIFKKSMTKWQRIAKELRNGKPWEGISGSINRRSETGLDRGII